MKRINFVNLSPEMFDEIKGKQVFVRFYENGEVKRTVQGTVALIHKTANVPTYPESSLLEYLEFEDGTKLSVREAFKFMDDTNAKQVFVEFE
ncbi:MAG: hypothetical protein NC324_04545 [Bacteroides sp.]|nr:hypothetical protein [Bacteroides sp.]